jgi:hypothetical protein
MLPILKRDFLLAKVIWHFNPFSAFKLKIKNILIALGLFRLISIYMINFFFIKCTIK